MFLGRKVYVSDNMAAASPLYVNREGFLTKWYYMIVCNKLFRQNECCVKQRIICLSSN
jgi:hypothetical protein